MSRLLFLVRITLLKALIGCLITPALSEAALAVNLDPPLYRIGFIVPLTGALSEFGAAIRNGVALAIEAGAGGFTPIFEDSRYDSSTALSAMVKLRTVDQVSAVYVFGGPMSDTLSPIAEEYSLPMFSTEYDLRYTRGRQYVVRFANNAADYAQALLAELRSRGYMRFGIVKVENQYHNTLSAAFIENLQPGQRAQVLYNFQPGESDFRSAIARLRARPFDALGIYLTPGMQHAFLQQMRALKLKIPLFGTDSFESREENSGVEDVSDGALYANSAVSAEFAHFYQAKFGSDSQLVHAALAYEFTRLVSELLDKQSPPATALDLLGRFAGIQNRGSVCGIFSYHSTAQTGQYFRFPIVVREVQAGQSQILTPHPALSAGDELKP